MSTEIRQTPETDAAKINLGSACGQFSEWYVKLDFARKLERERDSAKTLNRTLLDQLEAQAVRIEAMRDAIKEVWIEIQYAESGFAGLALRVCPNDSAVESVLNRMTEALAKLQPVLKP